jgi:hypothetical protein
LSRLPQTQTKSCAIYCQYSETTVSDNSSLILELNMDIRWYVNYCMLHVYLGMTEAAVKHF